MPSDTLPLPDLDRRAGAPRRCGVELEFACLAPDRAAGLIRDLFGGQLDREHEHRIAVRDTALGDFTVALDMLFAHPEHRPAGTPTPLDMLEAKLRAAVGEVGALVLPYEIACPPLPVERLAELDRLVDALRRCGAKGTEGKVFYAFGLHFNPELARRDPDHVLDTLKAYLLLSPWLRQEMEIDLARRLAPFVHPFPSDYVRLVLDPAYRPMLADLARDYVRFNPSRNRELDLWPLLTHLLPQLLQTSRADPHVKPRPTWHWRLPDSRVGVPGWSILTDWNRWVRVEQLAIDRWALDELGQLWRDCQDAGVLEDWSRVVGRWLPPA